ncbi:hypothetical protein MUY32_08980 [Enterobacter roggenkampii]|uniref:hypothetical protein n=1 Tax=Enterobacter cloacae complex TaxID=354276 RepID=UPI0006669176|nr:MULTISPECIES: hypothetical protein [Enterobacter cloacae complex]UQQ43556.1 hypothetical protein MUY32_08980 [Enterobacter roggenkampii]
MGKLTLVIEFEDGKEPPVHAHMKALGGRVVAVAFRDALSEDNPPKTITTSPQVLSEMRCFICNGKHPIGVACPFSSPTVVSNNA